ncbi:MAG: response regulator transcription factor [Solirubrobacteraceae bacterium]
MEYPDPGRIPGDRGHGRAGPDDRQGECGRPSCRRGTQRGRARLLRCLATRVSRREIGARLYISLNTVKTHTRELYRKLGATSRVDAVARAEALGLLERTESPG